MNNKFQPIHLEDTEFIVEYGDKKDPVRRVFYVQTLAQDFYDDKKQATARNLKLIQRTVVETFTRLK